MPPHYYWQPRIFRPSYNLEMTLSHCIMAGRSRQERSIKLEITKKSILFSFCSTFALPFESLFSRFL